MSLSDADGASCSVCAKVYVCVRASGDANFFVLSFSFVSRVNVLFSVHKGTENESTAQQSILPFITLQPKHDLYQI